MTLVLGTIMVTKGSFQLHRALVALVVERKLRMWTRSGSPNTMVVMPPLPLGKPFPPHSSSPQLALISFLSCSSPSCYIRFQLAPSPILDMSSPILDMYGVLLFGTRSYDPCPHSRALQQMRSPLSETHFVYFRRRHKLFT